MYLILLEPEFKERIWGGQKLKTHLNKDIPNTHIGESWEVACHENGNSRIKNGIFKGHNLIDVIRMNPMGILGYPLAEDEKFPLLLKFIDAKELLSVQVHPEDAYANLHEKGELGKNEAWYILDAEADSHLIVGLKEGVTKETFIEAMNNGQLEKVLNKLKVKKGDVINIPAGLIHAIGSGILLAEVQQNSDTTYRVYDWDRVGTDGEARTLHIEKSLEVIDFEGKHGIETIKGIAYPSEGATLTHYIKNQYFALETLAVTQHYEQNKEGFFELYMCIEGSGEVTCSENTIQVNKGESFIIPADVLHYTVTGQCVFIKTYVPKMIP